MRNILILLLLLISISGCGLHLRGHNLNEKPFPFTSLYLQGNPGSPFMAELRNNLELYHVKLTEAAASADLTLQLVKENNDKQINALSSGGIVQEYGLRYTVSIRAYDKTMHDWLPPDEISLQRILTFDPAQVLAKQMEEQMLYRDMVSDAVQQVMRRLSRAKPRAGLNDPAPAGDVPKPGSQPATNSQ